MTCGGTGRVYGSTKELREGFTMAEMRPVLHFYFGGMLHFQVSIT
jgi:hypothetical protein